MGCNYYTRAKDVTGKMVDVHIGKSSCGWVFALHDIPSMGLRSFDAWAEFLKDRLIYDEYDQEVSYKEMLEIISQRECDLLRHELSDSVRHGEGTYDYIRCDFS